MADTEKQSVPAASNVHGTDADDVFCDVDGTQPAALHQDQVAAVNESQRTTSLTGVERHSSTSSADMALPPHTRRRTTSTGLISGLMNAVEEGSKEKGREYYEEEMEWFEQPEHPQQKKSRPERKHSHGMAEKISQIYNAVEDSSKQKGREYFEEENTWPLH